jgi:GT2 family glycosyltransferase
MTSAPQFSVIIPTYNRAQKVVRAVGSVLAQTLADYDVWVIDDGSSDQTGELLEPFRDRIHYICQANAGAASARNHGIQASSGRFVAFLDSDDCWTPDKLEATAAAIRMAPDTGLFYSQCKVVDEAGNLLWIDRSRQIEGSAYLPLLMGNFLATSSAIVRRDALEWVGEFDSTLEPCEDWDYWLRLSRRFPITLVSRPLVIFEYASADKLTARTQHFLEAHDRVVEKALRLDPSLDLHTRQVVLANIAYVKGRICLEARDDRGAAAWFGQAVSYQPALLKARVYRALATAPWLRHLLPGPARRRLRLPSPVGGVH